ncbi:MAG: methylamine utilization MauE [Verrucomicrobia bacterium]|nr:MAG: methylamine utilization MauE [Verrucomicrobiota bacterium]
MTSRVRTWGSWIAHGVVASALALAGGLKLQNPAQFAVEIGNYSLFSAPMPQLAALYLPWLEICLALALLLPASRKVANRLSQQLLTIFCAALISTLIRGLDVECGCFGSATTTRAEWALARNCLFIAVLALGAWLERRPAKAPRP